MAGLKNN